MLREGLDLEGELLALATGSHDGEAFHLEGVRRILSAASLEEAALQTPPDFPLGERSREEWIAAGRKREPVAMCCSGKHAAMLATCVAHGWDVTTYRSLEHPLQLSLRRTIEELTGEEVQVTGTDGCGTPIFGVSLTGLARGFSHWALGAPGSHERRTYDAVRAFPEWVCGTSSDVTALIAGVPGLVAKEGAEGVYAAALPDGRAVALKIEDGAERARGPVMAAALSELGVEAEILVTQAETPLLGGGEPVGAVRAVRTLFSHSRP